MRKFYKDKFQTFEKEILQLRNVERLNISALVFKDKKAFKIVVNVNDYVEKGTLIMINEDAEKVFSPVSGTIIFKGTMIDINSNTVEGVEIENDFVTFVDNYINTKVCLVV